MITCFVHYTILQNLPSLERIDLAGCTDMIECPNLSGAPNLKYVTLNGHDSLPSLHSSIFSLPRLETLDLCRCAALRSLYSDYCSPTLQFLWPSERESEESAERLGKIQRKSKCNKWIFYWIVLNSTSELHYL